MPFVATHKIMKGVLKILGSISPINGLRVFFLKKAGYVIGPGSYISSGLIIVDNLKIHSDRVNIGARVSIGPRVTLIPGSSHNVIKTGFEKFGKIIIEDEAWIGAGVIILPGLRIGRGSIVGAGSVVTKDVPAFTVVAGSPARMINKISPKENTYSSVHR